MNGEDSLLLIRRPELRYGRSIRSGLLYWPKDQGGEMGLAEASELLLVDGRRMAVECVISTQDLDRSRDVILSRGINCENHRKNPVVLFDHGLCPEIRLPIGKAEDPQGAYTVRLEDRRAVAVTYFSQTLKVAAEIFALIDERILRGVSIGFRPEEVDRLPQELGGGHRDAGVLIKRCELIEYTHTAVPDNQDALTVAVQKGRVRGERLSEVVIKSLAPYAIPGKALVPSGFQGAGLAARLKAHRSRLHKAPGNGETGGRP